MKPPKARFSNITAVFVALRNEKGEYLLQRRVNTGYLDGYYDFSATGHLEVGESLLQCAVRETAEEIGVIVHPEDLSLIHINQNNINNNPYLNFTFLCEKWKGTPTICEPEKIDEMQFFSTDALPDKCTLNVRMLEERDFSESLTYSYVDDEVTLNKILRNKT